MLLRLDNVSKSYTRNGRDVRALEGFTLELDAGQFVAVCGPSGCGKSTLLLLSGGLMRPTTGGVVLEGHDVYDMSAESRARLRAEKIGFVFQQFHLVPYLNVLDNVLSASLGLAGCSSGNGRDLGDRAAELVRRFGLEDRAMHTPAELSTGERQRVGLARALLNRPKLLLADEPTGNLDEANGEVVLSHLREFSQSGGCVLLVTHDARAARLADRVVRIERGRMLEPALGGLS